MSKFRKIMPDTRPLSLQAYGDFKKSQDLPKRASLFVPQQSLLRTAVQLLAALHQTALNVRRPCSCQTKDMRASKTVKICVENLFKIAGKYKETSQLNTRATTEGTSCM